MLRKTQKRRNNLQLVQINTQTRPEHHKLALALGMDFGNQSDMQDIKAQKQSATVNPFLTYDPENCPSALTGLTVFFLYVIQSGIITVDTVCSAINISLVLRSSPNVQKFNQATCCPKSHIMKGLMTFNQLINKGQQNASMPRP